jgi:hypothetical protein
VLKLALKDDDEREQAKQGKLCGREGQEGQERKVGGHENVKDGQKSVRKEWNFMFTYIRIYSIVNHLVQDPALVPSLLICGFVDIALLLLQRVKTKGGMTWGLCEQLLTFMRSIARVYGGRLRGATRSCTRWDQLFHKEEVGDLGSNLEEKYTTQDFIDRSQQAIPAILQALRGFGIFTNEAPSTIPGSETFSRDPRRARHRQQSSQSLFREVSPSVTAQVRECAFAKSCHRPCVHGCIV